MILKVAYPNGMAYYHEGRDVILPPQNVEGTIAVIVDANGLEFDAKDALVYLMNDNGKTVDRLV